MTFAKTWTIALMGLLLFVALGCGISPPTSLVPQNFQGAFLSVSDQPQYDFGPVFLSNSAEHVFTVSNLGQMEATEMGSSFFFSMHFKYKGGTYPGLGGSCTTTLAKGAACTVVVLFEPSYNGNFTDSINISYFNGAISASTTAPIIKGLGFGGT